MKILSTTCSPGPEPHSSTRLGNSNVISHHHTWISSLPSAGFTGSLKRWLNKWFTWTLSSAPIIHIPACAAGLAFPEYRISTNLKANMEWLHRLGPERACKWHLDPGRPCCPWRGRWTWCWSTGCTGTAPWVWTRFSHYLYWLYVKIIKKCLGLHQVFTLSI